MLNWPHLARLHNFTHYARKTILLYQEFKQIATAGANTYTAAVTDKVWGEYVAAVCQNLTKVRCQKHELRSLKSLLFSSL